MKEFQDNYYPENPVEGEAFETGRKRPDMRMFYAVLLIFAVAGFIGIQTIQRLLGGASVDAQESADPARLAECCEELEIVQKEVATLYARWEELEAMQSGE